MKSCMCLAVVLCISGSSLRLQEPRPEDVAGKEDLVVRGRLSDRGLLSGSVEQLHGCSACRPHVKLSSSQIKPLAKCALVGSSDSLTGRRLGAVLDWTYDTIIRVNRVPTPEYFDDFGRRTDILFIRPVSHKHATFTTQGQVFTTMGGKMRLCSYKATDCPFKNVLLQGGDTCPRHFSSRGPVHCRVGFETFYPPGQPGWKPWNSHFPIAYQSEELMSFTDWLLNFNSGRAWVPPTAGFHAFIYAAVACDSVDLFGFIGNSTADGHEVTTNHNLALEHELIRNISKGKLKDEIRKNLPSCAPCMIRKMHGNTFHVY